MWTLWMAGLANGRCNECHMDDGLVQQFVVATVLLLLCWVTVFGWYSIIINYYMNGTIFPFWDDYDEHKLPFKTNCPPTCTCRFHFKS